MAYLGFGTASTMVASLLLEIGMIIIGISLIIYQRSITKIFKVMGKPDISYLLYIAALGFFIFSTFHYIAYVKYVPHLFANGAKNAAAFAGLYACKFISFLSIFIAGVMTSIVTGMYYLWVKYG